MSVVESTSKATASLWERAAYRWSAITGVLAVFLCLYTQHPYYQQQTFASWRPFFTGAFVVWLALGVFYVRVTLNKWDSPRYWVRDGALHILILLKTLVDTEGDLFARLRAFGRIARNRRVRTTLLGMCVKGFFTPLMTGFVAGHATTIMDMWLRHRGYQPLTLKVAAGAPWEQASAWWSQLVVRLPQIVPTGADFARFGTPWSYADKKWWLDWAYNWIFLVDCLFAFVGYATESRWMGNKTRSVEHTWFGWAVCIFCYPPFNNVLGTYMPLANGKRLFDDDGTAALVFKAIIVGLFAIYASATVAFGFKFSNLTNRGIVSRGPYKYVRHPAYLTKCLAWWFEHIPTLTIPTAIFLCGTCGVYALRAWTEERHLSEDPDYVAYKKKVPWVIFPGIY